VFAADAEELLPRSGQNGGAQVGIEAEALQRVEQLQAGLVAELVARVRTVDRDGQDGPVDGDQDVVSIP
jgi:hypothetical protein